MLKTSKEQHWQETSNRLLHTTDLLGMPLDQGIQETVIALNVLGMQTLASCEGHLDHGIAAPWVTVGAPDARPLVKIAHLKQMTAEQTQGEERQTLLAEAREARLVVKRLHMVERLKVMNCLSRFYVEHWSPYDQRLIINASEWSGISRVESQGADCQDCRTQEERAHYLSLYQEEMNAFASFLSGLYWRDND